MAKYYYKPHVQEIKRRFEDVKLLGSGSAEEWIKGLESEGKDRSQDPVRWEQWEAKGGLRKVNTRPNTRTAVGTRGKSASTTSTVNGPPPRYGLDSSGPGKTTEVPSNPPETTPTSISGQNPSMSLRPAHLFNGRMLRGCRLAISPFSSCYHVPPQQFTSTSPRSDTTGETRSQHTQCQRGKGCSSC